jgi:hypothetical protein
VRIIQILQDVTVDREKFKRCAIGIILDGGLTAILFRVAPVTTHVLKVEVKLRLCKLLPKFLYKTINKNEKLQLFFKLL